MTVTRDVEVLRGVDAVVSFLKYCRSFIFLRGLSILYPMNSANEADITPADIALMRRLFSRLQSGTSASVKPTSRAMPRR